MLWLGMGLSSTSQGAQHASNNPAAGALPCKVKALGFRLQGLPFWRFLGFSSRVGGLVKLEGVPGAGLGTRNPCKQLIHQRWTAFGPTSPPTSRRLGYCLGFRVQGLGYVEPRKLEATPWHKFLALSGADLEPKSPNEPSKLAVATWYRPFSSKKPAMCPTCGDTSSRSSTSNSNSNSNSQSKSI